MVGTRVNGGRYYTLIYIGAQFLFSEIPSILHSIWSRTIYIRSVDFVQSRDRSKNKFVGVDSSRGSEYDSIRRKTFRTLFW